MDSQEWQLQEVSWTVSFSVFQADDFPENSLPKLYMHFVFPTFGLQSEPKLQFIIWTIR
jgi:hypothetical protein